MKSIISKFPLFLLLIYSGYFIYLIHMGIAITIPMAVVFAFLVILYGYNTFMEHIKKADPNELLEKQLLDYEEKFNKKMSDLSRRMDQLDLKDNLTEMANTKRVKHGF